MNWFWESVHYKAELGDLIMTRVFGSSADESAVPDFGVQLQRVDLEQYLRRQSQRLAELIDSRTPNVQLVDEILRQNSMH